MQNSHYIMIHIKEKIYDINDALVANSNNSVLFTSYFIKLVLVFILKNVIQKTNIFIVGRYVLILFCLKLNYQVFKLSWNFFVSVNGISNNININHYKVLMSKQVSN